MAEFLVIRIPPEPDASFSWIVVTDDGTRLSSVSTGPLVQAVAMAAERKVIALAPGTEVLLTQVNLPVRSPSKLRQAIPYALEEQLADDVEGLHFAAGKRTADGITPIAATARSNVESWMDTLGQAGLGASQIVADTEGVEIIFR